jgi:hypothetical protein
MFFSITLGFVILGPIIWESGIIGPYHRHYQAPSSPSRGARSAHSSSRPSRYSLATIDFLVIDPHILTLT